MNGLRLAISFLTTLPLISADYDYSPTHWRTAIVWFPVIGALIGGLVWAVGGLASIVWSSWLAAMIAVTAWVMVTGGLHLDGLADCCDGLFTATSRERRLEIMRDPHIGAFGTLGLLLFLGLKVGAVQAVLVAERGIALPIAAAVGRMVIVWVAQQPAAREGGLGATFAREIRPMPLLICTVLPIVGAMSQGWRGGIALSAALLATVGVIVLARRRIGGVTGDVYGLSVELVELVVMLTFAM